MKSCLRQKHCFGSQRHGLMGKRATSVLPELNSNNTGLERTASNLQADSLRPLAAGLPFFLPSWGRRVCSVSPGTSAVKTVGGAHTAHHSPFHLSRNRLCLPLSHGRAAGEGAGHSRSTSPTRLESPIGTRWTGTSSTTPADFISHNPLHCTCQSSPGQETREQWMEFGVGMKPSKMLQDKPVQLLLGNNWVFHNSLFVREKKHLYLHTLPKVLSSPVVYMFRCVFLIAGDCAGYI